MGDIKGNRLAKLAEENSEPKPENDLEREAEVAVADDNISNEDNRC